MCVLSCRTLIFCKRTASGEEKNAMSRHLVKIWIGVLFFLLTTLSLTAQNERGSILGHVADNSGAAISGAKVTVRNVNTGISNAFLTTSTGDYVFVNLIPGTYDLTVEDKGFQ